jgi:transcriptional regulator with XRE-family HTH domain
MDSIQILARRLKSLRRERGWTLEQFAAQAEVSRAAISKIERGEVSPTAAILARLAAGLGVSVAALFGAASAPGEALSRRDGQALWTDPETGYARRNISPAGAAGAAEIVEIIFPAGARLALDNALGFHGLVQQLWVLEGSMEITLGGEAFLLSEGDCLFMRLETPTIFRNPGAIAARYAVIVSRISSLPA